MSSLRRVFFPFGLVVDGVVAIFRGARDGFRNASNPLAKAFWILSGVLGLAVMAAIAFAIWWVCAAISALEQGLR